jgi:hypothetical protein
MRLHQLKLNFSTKKNHIIIFVLNGRAFSAGVYEILDDRIPDYYNYKIYRLTPSIKNMH